MESGQKIRAICGVCNAKAGDCICPKKIAKKLPLRAGGRVSGVTPGVVSKAIGIKISFRDDRKDKSRPLSHEKHNDLVKRFASVEIIDVEVSFDDEMKQFTYEEFFTLLGFKISTQND